MEITKDKITEIFCIIDDFPDFVIVSPKNLRQRV